MHLEKDLHGLFKEHLVAASVGAAVVVLATNTNHVKGSHRAWLAVEIHIGVNAQLDSVGAVCDVHVEARAGVGPLSWVYDGHIVHAE